MGEHGEIGEGTPVIENSLWETGGYTESCPVVIWKLKGIVSNEERV